MNDTTCAECGGRYHTFVRGQWKPCKCYWRVFAEQQMARAAIPHEYREKGLGTFNTEGKTGNEKAIKLVKKAIGAFAKSDVPKRAFILFGERGTGKTTLASILLRSALMYRLSALFVHAERLLAIRMDADDEWGRVEDLVAPDVMALELGGEYPTKMTPWLVGYILTQRARQGKWTMVLSTVMPSDLRARYGDEVWAILMDEKRFERVTLQKVVHD